jgi:hypothetical protein
MLARRAPGHFINQIRRESNTNFDFIFHILAPNFRQCATVSDTRQAEKIKSCILSAKVGQSQTKREGQQMKTRKSPKISITVPPEILAEAERIAGEQGRSLSNAIAHLLRTGIEIERQAEAVLKEAAGPAYKTKGKK